MIAKKTYEDDDVDKDHNDADDFASTKEHPIQVLQAASIRCAGEQERQNIDL